MRSASALPPAGYAALDAWPKSSGRGTSRVAPSASRASSFGRAASSERSGGLGCAAKRAFHLRR